jgi:hypothetical protein
VKHDKIGKDRTYPNQVLRSGISGGGLTIGDFERESNWGRVYIISGRHKTGDFSVFVAASVVLHDVLSS